eukprot:766330-Hanusia_phi.AAC.4
MSWQGAVKKRKYDSMQRAVDETVKIFDKVRGLRELPSDMTFALQAVNDLSKKFSVKIFVLSVCPPSNPQYRDRIEVRRQVATSSAL